MKIVLAPNALKGCLTATQAAEAMARGVMRACPHCEIARVPVADGGDGLADVLIDALNGEACTVTVTGPRGDPVPAVFCHVPARRLAAIEMATASGLALLPKDRLDPMLTTTLGTGELIAAALNLGISHLVVGIGGSATNDGGIGMAAALGARFLDRDDAPVEPVGGALATIERIDLGGLDPRLTGVRVEAICDVDNPLLGERGAAHVYGPQKGATPEQVRALEIGLAHLATVIERDLGLDVRDLPGAGAAGGLGAGLKAFLDADLRRGVDLVLDLTDLDEHLRDADLVLTAEGQIDFQTAFGKAPAGVAEHARALGVPCIAIAGSVGGKLESLHERGIDAVFSLCPGPVSMEQAMAAGGDYLAATVEQAVRAFLAGRRCPGSRSFLNGLFVDPGLTGR
ncbi:MAG: glycerate kinase [Candidatus Competibacter sp.]|nr:glycerate kinase [Candidatus Competibacter sp.]MDG4585215.1 glycerate kinase [Candidatus Competibacter sp.]